MLEMMNGSKEFIDKMEAETRKGPVVVSTTRSRQQERQPDGTETPKMVVDDRKSQGRHVVKIRVNVGSPEGVVASGEDELQSASNGQVTPLTQVKVLTDGLNDLELFSKPLVIGRTLKHVEKREAMIEEEKESRRLEEREEDQMYKPTLPGQVDRVKEAATVGSFLISSTGTTSSDIKNKLKQSGLHQQNLPEMRPSNQSTSNTVRINVSSAPVETTMFSRNDEESTPYYSYNQLAYLYSHSGQSSPASDSGTCSDFDANTPPPLPKKKYSMIKKVSTIQLNVGNISKDHILSPHKGTTSLMSSSGDAESDDDISCDSLNSSELEHQVVSSSSSTSSDHLTSSHHITDDLHHLDELDEEDVDDGVHDVLSRRRMVQEFGKQKSVPPPLPPKKNHQKKILENRPPVETTTSSSNGLSSVETSITTIKDNKSLKTVSHPEVSRQVSVEERDRKHPKTVINPQVSRQVSVEERTYDQRNRVTSPNSTLERSDSSIYDSFYKFHLNENSDLNSVTSAEDCNSLSSTATMKSSVTVDGLDSFAGRKGYIQDGDVENATIRSSKGTIRGVKNRVRAGIATFLQMHSNKRWEEKEAGKVVVYTTTMGTVRETYLRCLKVRQIMRTNLVKFEERDAFMSREVQAEIKERMSSEVVALPQVFVEGQHLGDAETVERLNESGELRRILQPYKSPDACITCQVCGGYRLLPCGVCNGSKKSVHRNHFTTELVALKCMNCDEVGLVRCYAC